jgi:hypothetical protein
MTRERDVPATLEVRAGPAIVSSTAETVAAIQGRDSVGNSSKIAERRACGTAFFVEIRRWEVSCRA